MARTLVIGYGNRDRGDDGVAYEVINALRARLGQEPLQEEATGVDSQGALVDSMFVLQLAPEWLDAAAGYDQLVFVDAHVHPEAAAVQCVPVQAEYATAAFTHHMTPAMFLTLIQALYQREMSGWILSIRGSSFGFRRGLSDDTAAQVAPAVDQILRIAEWER